MILMFWMVWNFLVLSFDLISVSYGVYVHVCVIKHSIYLLVHCILVSGKKIFFTGKHFIKNSGENARLLYLFYISVLCRAGYFCLNLEESNTSWKIVFLFNFCFKFFNLHDNCLLFHRKVCLLWWNIFRFIFSIFPRLLNS